MSVDGEQQKEFTVDVVIPVLNGEEYIWQALHSIEKQTYKPKKIIVVDGGSSDKTVDIVKNYQCGIPIQIVKHGGFLSAGRNVGIHTSTSDYIAFLDADDEWYPNKLEEQMKIFRSSDVQNLGLVYCQYDIIDGNGKQSDDFYIFSIDPSIRGRVFDKILAFNKIAGSGSAVLVKRELFDRVGFFDEKLSAAEDWDMWLRLAEHCGFDFTKETLVRIRRHGKNMQNKALHMFTNRLVFYDKWMQILRDDQIPKEWVRFIAESIVRRFPRADFYRFYKEKFSVSSRKKVSALFWREHKLFTLFTILTLPIRIVRNSIAARQSKT